jgi:hypothetical protein
MNAFYSKYNMLPNIPFFKSLNSYKISIIFEESFEKCLNLVKI